MTEEIIKNSECENANPCETSEEQQIINENEEVSKKLEEFKAQKEIVILKKTTVFALGC